jgi:hypothetical protein
LATLNWVWFHLLGDQLEVEWQLEQFVLETGICEADFPVAEVPLWQLAQTVAGGSPLWSKRAAGFQAEVEWQVSQDAWVAM